VTTTDPEIVQATRNLHNQIRDAVGRQTQDIFDNPASFDPGNRVFHDHTCTGEEVIQEVMAHAQYLSLRFFLGCCVKTPAGS
jgi:hypothetical protein